MFDIGFPELLIVSIVALLVIGPERLPETVRTLATWMGRLRRSLANIRMELENEIGANEIRQQIHNDKIMREIDDAKKELNSIVNDANSTISELKESSKIDTNLVSNPKSAAPETPAENQDDRADEPERHTRSGG